jgi:hypothetical protein
VKQSQKAIRNIFILSDLRIVMRNFCNDSHTSHLKEISKVLTSITLSLLLLLSMFALSFTNEKNTNAQLIGPTIINKDKNNINPNNVISPNTITGSPLKYWGFESGNKTTGWEWGASYSPINNSLAQDSNLKVLGNHSLKVTLEGNDETGNSISGAGVIQKASSNPYFKEGDVVNYQWYTLIPTNFKFDPSWHVLTEWIPVNPSHCCQPDMQLILNGDKIGLLVINASGNSDLLWQDKVQLGHWYFFDLTVIWSTSNNGFVKLLVDDKPKVNVAHVTLDSKSKPYAAYMSQGLFRDKSINLTQSVYHDGMQFQYIK